MQIQPYLTAAAVNLKRLAATFLAALLQLRPRLGAWKSTVVRPRPPEAAMRQVSLAAG
jgi:hypothetical protein